MVQRYDIAIVGSGPAGLSASLNACVRKKKFIIFGNKNYSDKLIKAVKINNYLGLSGKSGVEFKNEIDKQLSLMNIVVTEEKVNTVFAMGSYFIIVSDKGTYEAKTVILATGISFEGAIDGEKEYLGRGISYCVTCDAQLCKNKVSTIISYSSKYETEAEFLLGISSEVFYVPVYKADVKVNSKIHVIKDKVISIEGGYKAAKVQLKNESIKTDYVFILRDRISPIQLVPGLKMNENHIAVDRLMQTNIKGCFAAGDAVGKPYQYIKAAGEGNIAALSAIEYLQSLK
ncbi:NAD(P)/FAD-dependent oxidoreductase [Inconstantimicrobium porci]|uniref:NAD(P)/FAD-dependent oxidoreductase n=1 Tax=Inconstantimicrobium porci TaxID=2652291 RepID=UPI002409D481|nr:NAD(P)/FAD-dependent oxidoreductase [Inconstantimicrobium porci]MDD6770725.1 NAD(P)/FAD-dependent oxidoreductase [Inconstantimicrobium porci]